MISGVGIWRCASCAATFFPARLMCTRCHGHVFVQDRVHEGVVQEVTVVRHVLGQTDWHPRRLANVRPENGPAMTVGLLDQTGPGGRVELFEQDGAPFGRRKASASY